MTEAQQKEAAFKFDAVYFHEVSHDIQLSFMANRFLPKAKI